MLKIRHLKITSCATLTLPIWPVLMERGVHARTNGRTSHVVSGKSRCCDLLEHGRGRVLKAAAPPE